MFISHSQISNRYLSSLQNPRGDILAHTWFKHIMENVKGTYNVPNCE